MKWLYSLSRQWLLIFGYAFGAMYLMRTYFIPALAAHQEGHLGGDPLFYHGLAMRLADNIRAHGLDPWTLHADGQGPAGVMALIYLVTQSQFSVITLNAMLHATTSLAIILILRRLTTPLIAFFAALPFILSPFQIFWFSQINKDSYVACGFMLFTLGLLNATDGITERFSLEGTIKFLILSGVGVFLIFIGRPYIVFLVLYSSVTILLCISIFTLTLKKKIQSMRYPIAYSVFCCVFILLFSPMTKGAASDQTLSEFANVPIAVSQVTPTLTKYPLANECLSKSLYGWGNTQWIPAVLDAKLKSLFAQRCLYFIQLYDTNPFTRHAVLDLDIYPSNLAESLAYFPRALMNGFFAPFPLTLLDHVGLNASVFFTMAPLEVLFFILTLPFLIIWLFNNPSKRGLILVPIALAASIVLVYGLGIPFTGALYRYRYPFWMLVFCINFSLTLVYFSSHLRRKPQENVT